MPCGKINQVLASGVLLRAASSLVGKAIKALLADLSRYHNRKADRYLYFGYLYYFKSFLLYRVLSILVLLINNFSCCKILLN